MITAQENYFPYFLSWKTVANPKMNSDLGFTKPADASRAESICLNTV